MLKIKIPDPPQAYSVKKATPSECVTHKGNRVSLSIDKQSYYAKRWINYFYERCAARAYDKMFSQGKRFVDRKINLKPSKENHSSVKNTLEILAHISSKNINEINALVQPLSTAEKGLFERITTLTWRFRHVSNHDVTAKGYLNLYSFDKLCQEKELYPHTAIHAADVTELANTDFVFFGVEFHHSHLAEHIEKTHSGHFYGCTAYLINEEHPLVKLGFLTLSDHYLGVIPSPQDKARIDDNFGVIFKGFPIIFQELNEQGERSTLKTRLVYTKEKTNIVCDNPLFSYADMKAALALYFIDFIRRSEDSAFKESLFSAALDNITLSRWLNTVFQCEFHLPHMLSTYTYSSVLLEKPDHFQLAMANNVRQLAAYLKDSPHASDDAIEALAVAIKEAKPQVVQWLLAHYSFERAPLEKILNREAADDEGDEKDYELGFRLIYDAPSPKRDDSEASLVTAVDGAPQLAINKLLYQYGLVDFKQPMQRCINHYENYVGKTPIQMARMQGNDSLATALEKLSLEHRCGEAKNIKA